MEVSWRRGPLQRVDVLTFGAPVLEEGGEADEVDETIGVPGMRTFRKGSERRLGDWRIVMLA
jgi:hypothetical protein